MKKFFVTIFLLSCISLPVFGAGPLVVGAGIATMISGVKDASDLLGGLGKTVSAKEIANSQVGILFVDQSGEVKGRVFLDDADFTHNKFEFIKSHAGYVFAIQKSVIESIYANGGSEATINSILIEGVRTGGIYINQYHEAGDIILMNGAQYRGNVVVVN